MTSETLINSSNLFPINLSKNTKSQKFVFYSYQKTKKCYLSMSILCRLNPGVKIISNLHSNLIIVFPCHEIRQYDISLLMMTILVFQEGGHFKYQDGRQMCCLFPIKGGFPCILYHYLQCHRRNLNYYLFRCIFNILM